MSITPAAPAKNPIADAKYDTHVEAIYGAPFVAYRNMAMDYQSPSFDASTGLRVR